MAKKKLRITHIGFKWKTKSGFYRFSFRPVNNLRNESEGSNNYRSAWGRDEMFNKMAEKRFSGKVRKEYCSPAEYFKKKKK